VVQSYGLSLQLRAGSQIVYAFGVAMATSAVLDAVSIAQAFQLQFRGGMVFQDATLDTPHVRAFIMDKLRSPTRYVILRGTSFKYVVDMSMVTSPYTVPDGDALVFANKPGASVQTGVGNDVIKVTASNQTVGTGWGRNEADGHDIVQVQADLENVTIKLKAP